MKALIFDSGPLINLSTNGLLYLLEELKEKFEGKFLITNQVKFEVVDHPLEIHRFELGAIRIQNLIDSGVIETIDQIKIDESLLKRETESLMEKANHLLRFKGEWMNIVSPGEMSCIALSNMLKEKGYETMIAVDERTTRILCENHETLARIMSDKMHQKIVIAPHEENSLESFRNHKFIRSPEIVFVAYKKGLINLNGKRVLEALLYATKFHGAAISFEEIEQLKKL